MLPGGESAIREPRRTACGLLYEIYNENFFDQAPISFRDNFSKNEIPIIQKLLLRKVNSPLTSSVGRLFDAVSSLLNICNVSNYEGQAAMLLEFAADENEHGEYPFSISEKEILIIDWQPMVENIITEIYNNISNSIISARFHNTLAKIILHVANKLKFKKIILSGGCFQNTYLTEKVIKLLVENDCEVYWHQRIPPNDGGISVGQIAAYLTSKKIKAKDLEVTLESKG